MTVIFVHRSITVRKIDFQIEFKNLLLKSELERSVPYISTIDLEIDDENGNKLQL